MTPSPAHPPPLQAHPSLSWLWTTTADPASTRKHERARQPSPRSSSRTAREQRQKRQRLLRRADQRDRVARVFQTEGIPQHVLLLLDVGSVEAFVVFLAELGPAGHDVAAGSTRWIFRDEALWSRMLATHFKVPPTAHKPAIESTSSATAVERTRCKTHQSKNHAMDKLLKHACGGGCASLIQFLAWSQEREWFAQHVDIIMGDDIVQPCLVEPEYRNVYIAAEELHVRKHRKTMLEPGFDLIAVASTSQVRCFIHVIDTQLALQSPWQSLSRNFGDAMHVIQQENQKNVAVVIPSTRESASETATRAATGLREIQRFAVQSDWNGQIGIVCYDKQQFRDFQAQKQRLLDAFGSID